MASKTSKKSTKKQCRYILKKGDRKGEKCNVNCVGRYCRSHNKKRLEKVKGYNKEICQKLKDNAEQIRLDKFKAGTLKKYDINTEVLRKMRLLNEYKNLKATYYGCLKAIDPKFKTPYIKSKIDYLETAAYREEEEVHYYQMIADNKKSDIAIKLSFEEYFNKRKEDELKDNNNREPYFTFDGTVEEAKKLDFNNESKILIKKYNAVVELIKAIENKKNSTKLKRKKYHEKTHKKITE